MERNCKNNSQIINFLQEQLAIPASFAAALLCKCEHNPGFLLITLWRHDLVSPEQLEQIFDWLES